MLNRSLLASLSFSSLSLLSLNAFADEPQPTSPPVPESAPASTPATPYAQAPAPYAPAYVAPTAVARPFPDREGFTIGFGLGPGSLSIGDESVEGDATTGLSFRLGGALTPNFLLQLDFEATTVVRGDESLQLSFFGASATGYVHPRIYLLGGLGVAGLAADGSDGRRHTDDSLGVLLGFGVEAYHSSSFGLSIELRGIATSIADTTVSGANLLIGFQWF